MKDDFRELARFVNLDALAILKTQSPAWADVERDIMIVKDIFNLEIGPEPVKNNNDAEIALVLYKIKKVPLLLLHGLNQTVQHGTTPPLLRLSPHPGPPGLFLLQ